MGELIRQDLEDLCAAGRNVGIGQGSEVALSWGRADPGSGTVHGPLFGVESFDLAVLSLVHEPPMVWFYDAPRGEARPATIAGQHSARRD